MTQFPANPVHQRRERRRHSTVAAGLALSLMFSWALHAATPAEQAQAAYSAGDWETVVRLYPSITEGEPDNIGHWLQFARALNELGELERAGHALDRAAAINGAHPFVPAFRAVSAHRAGDTPAAISLLRDAVTLGMTPQILESHPAFEALRSEPEFATLITEAEQSAYPCEHDPRYQAFVFWVGDWDVYGTPERVGPAGRNVITRDMRGCIIRERWGMVNGAAAVGESFNFFDPLSGTWRQLWLDASGNIVRYEGAFSDGAMRMQGTNTSAKGVVKQARVTWTPIDGGVHHVIEHFDDATGAWQTAFNGYYYPHEES